MSSLDENIFGRIAVLNDYLRPEQLEECLQIQRSESPSRRIGDILLERGYLTQEQLRTILEVRRKKVRKVQRDPLELQETDRRFGELALAERLVGLDDLEEAILEQQRLLGIGLHFRIGEILVARSKMKPADVLRILRAQGKRILICPACDTHYNVREFREGRAYSCARCRAALFEPKFLDTVAVDALLDGS